MIEAKVFNRLLHVERERKLYLRLHSRRPENVIPDYGIKFRTFEPWNNTEGLLAEPTYKFSDFLLPEPTGEAAHRVEPQYQKYLENKKQLTNIKIENFLTDRTRNPALLQLEGKSTDTTVTVVETDQEKNALAIAEKPAAGSLEENLKKQMQIVNEIAGYEDAVVKSMEKKYDIYRVHKGKLGRPKFAELSKEQILNYLKFDVYSLEDAFGLYRETSKLPDMPTIAASVVQKFAMCIPRTDMAKLAALPEFWDIFRDVHRCPAKLDNKCLVDTVFAAGLIYGEKRSPEGELMSVQTPKFLWHFLDSFLFEIKGRMGMLNESHIAMLCKALTKLQRVYKQFPNVSELNSAMVERIRDRVPHMAAHHISPLLGYMINSNLYNTLPTCKPVALAMVKSLVTQVLPKDPYLYPKDLVSCIVAVSKIRGDEPETTALVATTMEKLREIVLTESKELSFKQTGEVLKAFIRRRTWERDLFEKMYGHACEIFETQAEPVRIHHLAPTLWSMAEYYFSRSGKEAKDLLATELVAFMTPMTVYRLRQFRARIVDPLMSYVERMKTTAGNMKWWTRLVFALGSMNYKDHAEIVEYVMDLIEENKQVLTIEDWGYMLQGTMMLGCANKGLFSMAMETINAKNDFAAAELFPAVRCIAAFAQAGLLEHMVKEDPRLGRKLLRLRTLACDLRDDPRFPRGQELNAVMLWCLHCAGLIQGDDKDTKRMLEETVRNSKLEAMSSHVCALIAQAANGNKNIESRFREEANKRALEYSKECEKQGVENAQAKCGKDIGEELRRAMKEDLSYYREQQFEDNKVVAGCYVAPLVSEKAKVCFVFEYQHDLLFGEDTKYFVEKCKQIESCRYNVIKLGDREFMSLMDKYETKDLFEILQRSVIEKKRA